MNTRSNNNPSVARLDQALLAVSKRIGDAVHFGTGFLKRQRVKFAVCGGLAVASHGYVRATDDVNFVVSSECCTITDDGAVFFNFTPPLSYKGIRITVESSFSIDSEMTWLDEAIDDADSSLGIPVIKLNALVAMKLKSGRFRDKNDIVALILNGCIDDDDVRAYLLSLEDEQAELAYEYDKLYKKAMEE